MNLYLLGSELFLAGCILFTIDAIITIRQEISLHSLLYLLGCILFTVGCVLFTIDGLRFRGKKARRKPKINN